jgi:hypothetical protein
MSNRLLSLLSEIERSLLANDPAPDGGTWETVRLINFHQGLARLTLAVRSPAGVTTQRGVILLQHFTLADDTQCVKANLSWQGSELAAVHPIYSKPNLNWNGEAGQIAVKWLDGRPEVGSAEDPASPVVGNSQPLIEAAG